MVLGFLAAVPFLTNSPETALRSPILLYGFLLINELFFLRMRRDGWSWRRGDENSAVRGGCKDGSWVRRVTEHGRRGRTALPSWSRVRREQVQDEIVDGLGVLQGFVEFFARGIRFGQIIG